MFFGIVTLLTGLALSVVAAWFAIEGIMAIFAGLPIYAMIMGIVVEAGKVTGVTWIYRFWEQKTKLKFVMLPFVLVAMLLTSMGIFGLLSKAHLEQTAPVTNNSAKIERLDLRIARAQAQISDAEVVITQLDETIQVLIDANVISHPVRGARVVREKQQPQRDLLKQQIDEAEDSIDEWQDEKLTLNQEINDLEREVGPVKYIAAIIYEDAETRLEEAVRVVIIAFIFVFDPMAILLIMAGNYTLMGRIVAKPGDKPYLEEMLATVRSSEPESEDEPEPEVTDVSQLLENPHQDGVTVDQIRSALEEFQNREKDLSPAEMAQQGMLQEMLRRKQVTGKVRGG